MALRLKASEALEKLWRFTAILLTVVMLSSPNTLAEEASTASSEDGITVQSHTCSSAFSFNWETHYIADSLNEKEARWYKTSISQDGELGVDLDGPSSADFDLYVYESCGSSWICRPYEDDADEYCTIDARKGDYYIKVNAYSGKGNFNLYADLFKQDLIVSDIWTTPASVDEETVFDLHWSVKNLEKDKVVADFGSKLYVNGELKKECSITKDMVSREAVECHWLDQQFVPGTYTIKAVADVYDDVFETNEANNERTETLTVKNAPKYDLAPAYVLVDPRDPTDKDRLMLQHPIVNAGPDDIKGKVALKSFIDDNSTICTTNDGIVARDKFICEREITLKAGWYKLKTIADPDNEIPETDETNNEHQQDLLVSHKTDYDLTITEIWTSPRGELNDKMTFSVTAEIVNSGSDDITDSFKASLGADDDPSKSKECLFSGLKAGTSAFCTLENQKWTAGKHTVYAYVDIPDRQIPETDDDYNNKKKTEFDVTHVPETDLTVTSIYTDPASPTEKDTFSVKFDIKNAGSEAVPSGFKSNVFINGEPKGTWCYTINLGAGSTETCSFAKQKWAPGSYAVRVFADAEDVINELTETNNELEKQIEISQYCKIKDGSAADCDCNTNTDCPSGYYCNLKDGYDPCKPLACKDECTQTGYLCSQGDSYECGNFDTDTCLDKKLKQVCSLSQKCSQAKGGCEEAASPVKLQLEDSPSHDITVYKQPGDTIEVTITSEKLQDIDFSQPENFTLTYGVCGGKTAAAPGETKCVFQISETTAAGKYQFVANEKTATVAVIEKPKAVIVTNKQKLNEHFSNDKAGVKALLEQAYQYASNEMDTVVYYLDREAEGHPFQTFNDYKETFAEPKLTDNTYASKVADFVKSRCSECSILLLGDDFVVPFHRHNVINEKGLLWWKDLETSNIYTDLPYNSVTLTAFSQLDYDKFFQSGPVAIVIPSYMGKDDNDFLELKKALVDTYHSFKLEQNKECSPIYFGARTVTFPHYCKGECFNTDGCEVGNKNLTSTELITVLQSEEVGCNSFSKLEGKTLILIGDKENNQAMACFPWVQSSEYPLISLQRNVWDGSKGAILVNLPEEHRSLGMYVLTEVLARGEVYTYIPQGSDFEIIPSLKELLPFSTCDDAVSIDKNGIYVVEPGSMLFCAFDLPTGGKASAIGLLGKGGKAFKAVTAPAKVAKEYKRLYELGKKAGKEADIAKALEKAPTSLPYISLRFEKFGKAGARKAFDDFMEKALPEMAAMPQKDFSHFVKGLDTLVGKPPTTDISKYTVEDIKNVGKGAGYIEKNIKGGLENFQKTLPTSERSRALKAIGVYVDDVIGKYTHVLYEPKQGIFMFRGKELITDLPIKKVNGEEVIDWNLIKNGFGGVNRVKHNLEFVKKLPESEKATFARLSLGHVGKSPNIFIPASKKPLVAVEDFAKEDGFVFIINPRVGNTLDVRETLSLQLKKREIPQSNYEFLRDTIEREDEVAFIEKIDIEEFLGVVRVKAKKVVKGSFDKNPDYRPDTPNDIEIAIKETGA